MINTMITIRMTSIIMTNTINMIDTTIETEIEDLDIIKTTEIIKIMITNRMITIKKIGNIKIGSRKRIIKTKLKKIRRKMLVMLILIC